MVQCIPLFEVVRAIVLTLVSLSLWEKSWSWFKQNLGSDFFLMGDSSMTEACTYEAQKEYKMRREPASWGAIWGWKNMMFLLLVMQENSLRMWCF